MDGKETFIDDTERLAVEWYRGLIIDSSHRDAAAAPYR